jgi:hypothetical protein
MTCPSRPGRERAMNATQTPVDVGVLRGEIRTT